MIRVFDSRLLLCRHILELIYARKIEGHSQRHISVVQVRGILGVSSGRLDREWGVKSESHAVLSMARYYSGQA